MASIYTRDRSPYFWLRFKAENGQWKCRATGFRTDNIGDRKQAELLAREVSHSEKQKRPLSAAENWGGWVDRWMEDRYGSRENGTLTTYRRHWRHVLEWLTEHGLNSPRQIAYRHAVEYRDDRIRQGASQNTAVHELKFMGQVMQEAFRRGYATGNPISRLGMQRTKPKPKVIWSHEAISKVSAAIVGQPHWMRCVFHLALFQAVRLRQMPRLSDIDFERGTITYWRTKTDPFSHPIDARAVEGLRALVEERKRDCPGAEKLCDIPTGYPPSVTWRRFLDSLGLKDLTIHGLRASWITRACLAGVHQSLTKRFVNHGSTAVHEVYQRLSADDLRGISERVSLPQL